MKKFVLALIIAASVHTVSSTDLILNEQKTYVSADRILVMQHGIFYIDDLGMTRPVQFISQDANGLFMVDKYVQCPACGIWSSDGNLHRSGCPYSKK